jgi:homoserine dehydrogenase
VPAQGIRGVTLADVGYADSCGYKIKLLGRAIRQDDDKICAFVAPHLVPGGNPLAGVEDVFNAIAVNGNAIGDAMFYVRGAGKLPTASAVVADVIDIAKDLKKDHRNQWGPGAEDLVVSSDILSSRWYVRVNAGLNEMRELFGDLQALARGGAPAGEIAFLTREMTEPEVREKLTGLEVGSLFRVLG